MRFSVLDPAADACAAQVAELIQGDYDDPQALQKLAQQVDLVTFDFENVPVAAVHQLQRELGVTVFPPPDALAFSQDRLLEKNLFCELGIPTPPFAAVDSLADLHAAVTAIGLPAVLKTRRLGYDGKGQRVLRKAVDVMSAWQVLGNTPLILEGFVDFECEVSILSVRNRRHQAAFYPLIENQHHEGILRLSQAPFQDTALTTLACDYAGRLLQRLDYVGLLALELFVADGTLLANEMAPRVHNSGHWTIEGAHTSQFENHLRAICDLPLGSTSARGYSAMLNFIGELPPAGHYLTIADSHFHAYGKAARPGRKVGHVTLRADAPELLQKHLRRALG
jgi:5-(carboxyamino)imidazole ribonucleotide synthase